MDKASRKEMQQYLIGRYPQFTHMIRAAGFPALRTTYVECKEIEEYFKRHPIRK